MAKKLTGRQKLMANKTTSHIPKTPKQKKEWIAARKIAVKQSGARSEAQVPFALVTTIFKNADKAGKIPKAADIKKAKYSKTVASYRTKKNPTGSAAKRNK